MSNRMHGARPTVRFELASVKDEAASRHAGTPVYRNAEYAVFRTPGDKHTEVWKEVTPDEMASWKNTEEGWDHKTHVPALYDAWKSGLDAPVNGTALKDWPSVTPMQVHQALALGIRTVEDFANLTEDGLRNFGFGARELQRKARAFLDYGNEAGKVVEQVAAQQAQLDNQTQLMQQMQQQMEEMKAALAAKDAALAAHEPRTKGGQFKKADAA